ncbi:MAG TPA: response regulator [Opitutaceae bacterium]|nr:response regulator [Opitutaceae bacterium]
MTPPVPPRTRPILIVDDDPDAVALTKHALAKAGIKTEIDVRQNGDEAIRYLKDRLAQGDHTLPLVLFLDLKMPGTDGFQVLDWIRQQPRLRQLLTVVLSSSTNSRDVDKAYALGAKTYFGKYPVASDVRSVFQLANAMLTVDEIEKYVLPGIRPAPTNV